MGTREVIEQRLKAKDESMSWLSKKLGRNAAYIHQYLTRHTPQELDYEDKLKVSALLGIPLAELGITAPASPGLQSGTSGISEEAEGYVPPKDSFLSASPHIAYFTARSHSLDRHRLAVHPGDILVVDIGSEIHRAIRSEDAVVVQLYNKEDMLRATTVIRQFIAPNLLITNSSKTNSIIRMDDESLPFEPVIKGRIQSVIRAADADQSRP